MNLDKFVFVLTAALLLSPLGVAQSAEVGARSSGVVNQTPTRSDSTMIVGDVVYNVAKNVVVHATATRTVSVDVVRANQKIQFTSTGGGPGRRATITEIWIQ